MTLNTNYRKKIVEFLADEAPAIVWNIAVGDTNTTTPSVGNLTMDNELKRATATFSYSGDVGTWSLVIPGMDSTLSGKTAKEFGVFDAASSGDMIMRDVSSSGQTLTSDFEYEVEFDATADQTTNTSRLKITDKTIENVWDYFSGTTTETPTHVAFSTHLIFDTMNATTDWSATGGAVATSENRQEGTNSIDLTKTTGSTDVYMAKTLSSVVDASSVETVRLWLRINSLTTQNKLTTSDCVEIRIGNDSSNYKSITLDNSDLTTIWKLYSFDIDDFADTGSPDLSTIDYLYVGLVTNNTTDTWSSGEVLVDFLSGKWALTDADNTLHEEVVRKAISNVEFTDSVVQYNGLLSTSEGNTYNYYYVGLFDDATAGDMYLVNELYLTDKDANKQLNFYVEIAVRLI